MPSKIPFDRHTTEQSNNVVNATMRNAVLLRREFVKMLFFWFFSCRFEHFLWHFMMYYYYGECIFAQEIQHSTRFSYGLSIWPIFCCLPYVFTEMTPINKNHKLELMDANKRFLQIAPKYMRMTRECKCVVDKRNEIAIISMGLNVQKPWAMYCFRTRHV